MLVPSGTWFRLLLHESNCRVFSEQFDQRALRGRQGVMILGWPQCHVLAFRRRKDAMTSFGMTRIPPPRTSTRRHGTTPPAIIFRNPLSLIEQSRATTRTGCGSSKLK
ncbi:MAG: hypothetical protein NDI90_20585 [Nitrospira sp. BO4]|jgi:hypothetical protein|nr:hypothetical protein [Nitrospira sp. BO4]